MDATPALPGNSWGAIDGRTAAVNPAASRTGKDGDEWLPYQITTPRTPGGPPVNIRHATASDRQALAKMMARCSEQTRTRRFHKYVRCFPEPYLTEALAGHAAHFALLAQIGEAVVGLASCVAADPGSADPGSADPGSAELAVLVEDSWQRVGVGGRLLRLLVAHADDSGMTRLKAWVLASEAWILPVLGGYGTCEAWLRHGELEVTVYRDGP